ncbi:hypothetical protein PsorP6_014001 [Peronosclerospora sorghi]|uniref:Uncharacterized protein n=1 Tax=Peronosclerospora sorghi TaxID=230839 RepID=A0ACC0VFQ5_9STRA|nr:hypothetical protein PsorP6_014001 [Peronosclerospora sorghi]
MTFASSTAASSDLNGWYPCYELTFSDEGAPNNKTAECATIKLPLCYPGICKTHESASSKTVDIFVKRMVATSANPTTASNVWLIQGGPGYSSTTCKFYLVMIPFFTRTAFLALCEKDEGCNKHFQSRQLNETIQDVLTRLDKEPTSTCASIITQVNSTSLDGRPSMTLKLILGNLLKDPFARPLIPPVVYRLNRCAPKDVNVLKQFVDAYNEYFINTNSEDNAYESDALYYLIVFSELWEQPAPSKAEIEARIAATKFMDGGNPAYLMNPVYCVFSKEQSSSCQAYGLANYTGNPIMYARDQYWNKSATIPAQASVLLLSGKLDPVTNYKYAEYLLESLKGDNKELITFEYATHGIIASTNMIADDALSETCGMRLLASYVENGGNLARLDKSCVNAMPPFSLAIPPAYLPVTMGTDEAYDGEYIVTDSTTRKTQG